MNEAPVGAARCATCPAQDGCPIGSVLDDDHDIAAARRHLRCDEHLYWRDDPFDALFLVVCGGVKAYDIDINGNERCRGFYFADSILGFDSIGHGRHRCHTVALEDTLVCRLPFKHLLGLCMQTASLQAILWRRMSEDLAHAQILAGDYSATERLANFILEIAADTESGQSLRLPMPRRDIANYLRLAPETVSRVISDLRQRALIACHGRDLAILDGAGLRAIAEPALFD